MSTRGRRPKPSAMKELAGNPGHRPLNGTEPKPRVSSARAPRGLGQEGGRFYRKYGRALAVLGILTEVDEPALQMAAEHFEVAVMAFRTLREMAAGAAAAGGGEGEEAGVASGLLIEGSDGLKKNPILQVARDNSAALRSYLVEFGMTPAARSKLHIDEAEQISLADILFGEVAERVAERQERET